jgi:hypothetical protein
MTVAGDATPQEVLVKTYIVDNKSLCRLKN